MIGAIIGDIVGSRFEFNNYKKKDFELFTDECYVTDDSIMTIAVAKAIMEAENIKNPYFSGFDSDYYTLIESMTTKYMQEIGRKYPNCGYGDMFYQWIFSNNPKPYNSFGNGSAMRISPVGYAARTENEAIMLSGAVTRISHNNHEGIKGAEAVAVAIFMAIHGFSKNEIRDKITGSYYKLDFTIDEIRDTYEFNETCQETVPQAIEAFLESNSFEDSIRIAVSVGGDSDTLAAITGSIAEAYYGVPEIIKDKALTYLDEELRRIYDQWFEFTGYPINEMKKDNLNKSLNHVGTKTLVTDRFILRRFTITDAENVYSNWTSDSEVSKYMRWEYHKSIEETKLKINDWINRYRNNNYYQWAITLRDSDEPIGAIGLFVVNESDMCGDFGYSISRKYWGMGVATEALKTVLKFAFEVVEFNRIESYHSINNPASGKVMQKVGMKLEGLAKQKYRSNVGFEDSNMYSILREEFSRLLS